MIHHRHSIDILFLPNFKTTSVQNFVAASQPVTLSVLN